MYHTYDVFVAHSFSLPWKEAVSLYEGCQSHRKQFHPQSFQSFENAEGREQSERMLRRVFSRVLLFGEVLLLFP